jgi:hypothetical protein
MGVDQEVGRKTVDHEWSNVLRVYEQKGGELGFLPINQN